MDPCKTDWHALGGCAWVLKSESGKAKGQRSCHCPDHCLEPEADNQALKHLSSFFCQAVTLCLTHHLSGDYEKHIQTYRGKITLETYEKALYNKNILLLLVRHPCYSNFKILASVTTQILQNVKNLWTTHLSYPVLYSAEERKPPRPRAASKAADQARGHSIQQSRTASAARGLAEHRLALQVTP